MKPELWGMLLLLGMILVVMYLMLLTSISQYQDLQSAKASILFLETELQSVTEDHNDLKQEVYGWMLGEGDYSEGGDEDAEPDPLPIELQEDDWDQDPFADRDEVLPCGVSLT